MNIANMLAENISKFGEYDQFIHIGPDKKSISTNVEIEHKARLLATGLKELGISKGDIVAVCVGNIPQISELINGILRTGAVFLPIIYALTPREINYILNHSKAKMIISEEQFRPKIEEAVGGVDSLENIVILGETGEFGSVSYERILANTGGQGDVEKVSDNDLAILMYTSGTTGTPKGVMLSHHNLRKNMLQGAEVWPPLQTDRLLIAIPMNHIYGVLFYNESCAFGTSIVYMPWFDPDKVLELISEFKISVIPLVPTMIVMMMEKFNSARYSMDSIRYIISAGAPLAEDTWKRARAMFDIELYHGYGLTEAGPTISRQREDRPFRYGSVGPPLPGIQVKIVDEKGNEVPPGKEGEIISQGDGNMRGYLNRPRETEDAMKDGWLYTGDLGRIDEQGELFITGRKKDLIIRGGENIDPGVAENWLYKHPAVLEAAVVAMPDPKYGEEVAAAVALRQDRTITEKELLEYTGKHIHAFFAPKRIFFFDTLPKTSTGKILKRAIKEVVKEKM